LYKGPEDFRRENIFSGAPFESPASRIDYGSGNIVGARSLIGIILAGTGIGIVQLIFTEDLFLRKAASEKFTIIWEAISDISDIVVQPSVITRNTISGITLGIKAVIRDSYATRALVSIGGGGTGTRGN